MYAHSKICGLCGHHYIIGLDFDVRFDKKELQLIDCENCNEPDEVVWSSGQAYVIKN